jgi:hypothetical protein
MASAAHRCTAEHRLRITDPVRLHYDTVSIQHSSRTWVALQFQDQLFTHKKINKKRIFYTTTILVSKFDLYYVRLKIFVC